MTGDVDDDDDDVDDGIDDDSRDVNGYGGRVKFFLMKG